MKVELNLSINVSCTLHECLSELCSIPEQKTLYNVLAMLLCEGRTYGCGLDDKDSVVNVGGRYCVMYDLIPYINNFEFVEGSYTTFYGRDSATHFLVFDVCDNLPESIFHPRSGIRDRYKAEWKRITQLDLKSYPHTPEQFINIAERINQRLHIIDKYRMFTVDDTICNAGEHIHALFGGTE